MSQGVPPEIGSPTQKPSQKPDPLIIVIVVNIAAVIIGAVIGYPTSPVSWLNSYGYLVFFIGVFCVLPMALTLFALHFVAKRRRVPTSKYGFYLPSLLYAPALGYAAYLMSFAFYMADHQESGSEYIPFILGYFGITGFWVVPLITFVTNLILIFSQRPAPLPPAPIPPQSPTNLQSPRM